MQLKIFTIPILGGEDDNEQMNRFLRANRVASIEKQFCIQGESAFWTFCVTCADGPLKPPQSESERR